jgi:hypothetical protein
VVGGLCLVFGGGRSCRRQPDLPSDARCCGAYDEQGAVPLKRLRLLDRHVRSLDQAPGVHIRLLGVGGASGGAHDEQGERHHPPAGSQCAEQRQHAAARRDHHHRGKRPARI